MTKDKLKEFHDDEAMKDAFAEFVVGVLEKEAVRRVMARQDTSGIADARSIIMKAFAQLSEQYGTDRAATTINRSV